MHRGPWRKLSGNQLSYHWFKNFCSSDLFEGTKVVVKTGQNAFVHGACFFRTLPVPL